MTDFLESDHPRGSDGKFSSGSGGEKKQKITASQKSALEWYSEQGFHEINSGLRSGRESSSSKKIDEAIANNSLESAQTLYRGISRDSFKKILGGDMIRSGTVIEDKGFLSTSSDMGMAKSSGGANGVILKISAPEGQNAIKMSDISSNSQEKEVLLPRGQKLKITGITPPDPSVGRYFVTVKAEAV